MDVPLATYRIQFNPLFGFGHARQIVSYLSELGISSIYASPILKAKKGSTHGYDVVDPTRLNSDLGTEEEFLELIRELHGNGMKWIQDIVPNHMAYDSENQILMDILENGPNSRYFEFFDIDWDHPYESIKGKLLAPFLGSPYAECLENGEIQLKYDAAGLSVNYYELKLPLKIESYFPVFSYNLDVLEQILGKNHPDLIKFLGILYFLKSVSEMAEVQYDQIKLFKKMLWEIYTGNEKIKKFVDNNLLVFNGEKGKPESFNLLDDILSNQFFRLAFWKVATEEINYRRFFNINGLISLKVKNPEVFDHTHSLIFKMVQEKVFSGLRIDHIDGLYDPIEYLTRVREKVGDIYIVVEKILDLREFLPPSWPVDGTTGYDFLNYVNGVFCHRQNEEEFTRVYSLFASFPNTFGHMVWDKKRLMIGKHMASDIDNLAHLMKRVFSRHRYGRDIALYGLRRALVEIMALFPVYRTYATQDGINHVDQSYIRDTVAKAKGTNPELLYNLNLIERFLLLEFDKDLSEEEKMIWLHFVMRFQQFTSPLMAKALEDTLFYIYNRLSSLNEVGGKPNKFGISLEEFHDFNSEMLKHFPHAMNSTSTHDTKRSEDVRARINVLSEMPQEWETNLQKWCEINRWKKKLVKGIPIPDKNDEYFLYQTLLGTFPFYESELHVFIQRIKEYIIKAVREAKVHTGWLKPDIEYESAYLSFVENILENSEHNLFFNEFRAFQSKIAIYGIYNSLSQVTLKITCPGVPDFYQGTELWDFSLVDPDNRRPVDFAKRESLLKEIKEKEKDDIIKLINELISTREDGKLKLFLIYRLLRARRENMSVFQQGEYVRLESGGTWKDHIIVFGRKLADRWAIVIAPRFVSKVVQPDKLPLGPVWRDTFIVLPSKAPLSWKDAISAQSIKGSNILEVNKILEHFPTALIVNQE